MKLSTAIRNGSKMTKPTIGAYISAREYNLNDEPIGYEACALGAALVGAGVVKLKGLSQEKIDGSNFYNLCIKTWPFLKNERDKITKIFPKMKEEVEAMIVLDLQDAVTIANADHGMSRLRIANALEKAGF